MQINKILRYIVLGGVFLLPIIPFIVANSMFFPFITGKNFFFRIVTEIVFGSWVILALRDLAYRPKRSWIIGSFSAFIVFMALATIFGIDPHNSFWGNFERMEGYVTILHLFAYFVVVASVLSTKQLWSRLLNTSLAVSVLISLYSVVQLAGGLPINQGGVRVDATFGNASYLAVYLLFHIFISLLLLYKWRGARWGMYMYGVVALLEIFLLFQTGTRGSMLGLLGGLFVSAVLISWKEVEHTKLRKTAAGAVLAIVVLVGLFFAIKDSSFVRNSLPLQRLAEISLEDSTTQSRFTVWGMAWSSFLENPVLGTGQENFNIIFNKYFDPALYNQEPWFDRAHNAVLDWLTSGGILGFLAYIGLFVFSLRALWKKDAPFSVVERSLVTGMLVGYFFHNLFVFDNVVSYLLFGTMLAYVHSRTTAEARPILEGKTLTPTTQQVLGIIAVGATVWALYFFNVPGMLASRSLIQSFRAQAQGPEAVLSEYKKALSYDTYSNQEVREQLMRAAQVVASRSDVANETKQKFVTLARDEMAQEIIDHPHDARTQLFMGDFLNKFRQFDDARIYLERAHELSPGKQTMLFALADNAFGQSNVVEALAFAQEAFELEPDYRLARTYYAAMLVYNNRNDEAEALLKEAFGTSIVPDSVLINAYANTNNVSKVIELWNARIEADPTNVQARISLSAAYVRVGDIQTGIAVLRQAALDIPVFAEQAEEIITQIQSGELQ